MQELSGVSEAARDLMQQQCAMASISSSTLAGWVGASAALLAPLVEAVREEQQISTTPEMIMIETDIAEF